VDLRSTGRWAVPALQKRSRHRIADTALRKTWRWPHRGVSVPARGAG